MHAVSTVIYFAINKISFICLKIRSIGKKNGKRTVNSFVQNSKKSVHHHTLFSKSHDINSMHPF